MKIDKECGRRAVLAAGLAAGLMLAGCGGGGLGPDADAEAVAKTAYDHLAAGQIPAVRALLLPEIEKQTAPETFSLMQNLIPKEAPQAVERLNWRAFAGTSGSTQSFQHAYDYSERRVILSSELLKVGSEWRLRSFNVNVQMKPA